MSQHSDIRKAQSGQVQAPVGFDPVPQSMSFAHSRPNGTGDHEYWFPSVGAAVHSLKDSIVKCARHLRSFRDSTFQKSTDGAVHMRDLNFSEQAMAQQHHQLAQNWNALTKGATRFLEDEARQGRARLEDDGWLVVHPERDAERHNQSMGQIIKAQRDDLPSVRDILFPSDLDAEVRMGSLLIRKSTTNQQLRTFPVYRRTPPEDMVFEGVDDSQWAPERSPTGQVLRPAGTYRD